MTVQEKQDQSGRLTRRAIISGLVFGPAASAAGAVSSDSLMERIERASQDLADAMSLKHGGKWKVSVNHDTQIVLVFSGS